MVKEEILELIVKNNLEVEVYDMLHYIIIAKMDDSAHQLANKDSELKLIKKFANANKLDVIQDILKEAENDTN